MTTLVLGASGATGQLLVQQLIKQGELIRIIVRSKAALPDEIKQSKQVSIVEASVLEMSDDQLFEQVKGCDAVASCLGHRLSFQGMFGHPRRLVADTTRRLCNAIKASQPVKPMKFVLMNSSGVSNRDLNEKVSFSQQCVIWLLRTLLPPHVDNEEAADYLRKNIGHNDQSIQWTVVRPDGLVDENDVTAYSIYPSPMRSAIFDAGKVSRINVSHFMSDLIINNENWLQWKGKMPVIYTSD